MSDGQNSGLSKGRRAAITRQNNAKTLKAKARIAQTLKRIPAEAKKEIRRELAAAAEGLCVEMRGRVPVESGELRDSITWRYGDQARVLYSQGGGGDHELSVRISAGNYDVRYAHLVEFGAAPHIAGGQHEGKQHPGAPAQPFFYPTIRGNKRKIDRAVSNAVIRAIRRARSSP
ncbi:HK97 gp10 family phage protein [Aureimonas ureilytica]|uniref:HK97 gp10 family phage protein n=1 Tax=Aureimonas ureilytica TaxID=401562 RepID=UPI000734A6B9|nr:HK97 gp10 family phage protein [Aureimonas ureilytica]